MPAGWSCGQSTALYSTIQSHPLVGHGSMELETGDPTMTWRVDPSSAKQGSAVGLWPPNQSHNAAPHHRRHAPPSRYNITLARHCTSMPRLAHDVSRRRILSYSFILMLLEPFCQSRVMLSRPDRHTMTFPYLSYLYRGSDLIY